MPCRGIRGATTVETDIAVAILAPTRELLGCIVAASDVQVEEVAGALFTATDDPSAAFPAQTVRGLRWPHVALLDAHEILVPDSLPRCVRVLIDWNTDKPEAAIRHVHLHGVAPLGPNLQGGAET